MSLIELKCGIKIQDDRDIDAGLMIYNNTQWLINLWYSKKGDRYEFHGVTKGVYLDVAGLESLIKEASQIAEAIKEADSIINKL